MTTITVTPDLVERLGNLGQRIEFRDQKGQLVGLYLPADPTYVNPIDGSSFTEEEIQRMADQPIEELDGEPLDEVSQATGTAIVIFRVAWAKAATNDLEFQLRVTDDPDEIVRVALAVNQRLQIEGNLAGESRAGTLRVVIESPLTCYFRYRASDRTVIVVAICVRRRRK